MALVTLATVKNYLSILDTSEDAQLTQWVGYADAEIKDYCGWDLEQTSYPGAAVNARGDSGYYSGDWSPFLRLRQVPVVSVTAIYLDNTGNFGQNPAGAFPAANLLTYGVDYTLHWDGCLPGTQTPCSYAGIVERIPDVWTGNIRRRIGEINPRYTEGQGNILVSYTAGYPAPLPPPLEAAACQYVAFMRANQQTGGVVATESLGAHSWSLRAPESNKIPELATIKSLLARYRRMAV